MFAIFADGKGLHCCLFDAQPFPKPTVRSALIPYHNTTLSPPITNTPVRLL